MGCRPPVVDERVTAAGHGPRALFLDRDGVVNVDRGYVSRVEAFEFVPGIFELCRAAIAHEHLLVVVTNQAGIGRGLYGEDDFHRLTRFMLAELRVAGAPVAAVYWCPHHPTAGVGPYLLDCPCRKPAPGMLLAARDDLGIDLEASALVGDKAGDLEAGARAAVGRLVLLGEPGDHELPAGARTASSLALVSAMLFEPVGITGPLPNARAH